jgi:hypothetical protein
MVLTAALEVLRIYTRVNKREVILIESQASINRLASIIFCEPQEGSGYAILHIEKHADLSIIRFNERFLKLID